MKMFTYISAIVFLGVLGVGGGVSVYAQEAPSAVDTSSYVLGEVRSVVEEGVQDLGGFSDAYQVLLVEISSGKDAGTVETIEYFTAQAGFTHSKLHEGDPVILARQEDARGVTYSVLDQFRLPIAGMLAALFVLLAVVLGRWRGVMSLVGLAVSFLVLVFYVVPHIMGGESPLVVSAIGATIIACTSLFLAHGFTKRTGLALAATLFVLALAFGLAYLSVVWGMLTGASSEEAMYLQLGYLQSLDLRGLLLGGLVIGALGVLDDVTTAQVAAVEEIYRADSTLSLRELYARGIMVGREHIASLVNTLALAYVGASFPLFLLFSMPDSPPLWVVLNSESVTEELFRAFIGGSALMLAVPVSTILAAWAFAKGKIALSPHARAHKH